MEYYVLNYDFNKKELYYFNIFNNIRFLETVEYALDNYIDKKDFKEKIDTGLKSVFWSRREYELFIGDAFEENLDMYKKIDAYSQIKPNLDILVDYILNNQLEKQ